ncbi:MAG: 7,8-didemethyl-8-hydroxy-5-deazariboflavin synthase subunit CofH [Candidatus Hadarchaeum sp.]|uniref:7,8-didemethyl-8-hydroxy-5-deazariboflavin synthase subunit CofH n=1 Tax=Candidatus Hadarchaeum sp. TaxID=2883567 RepID=UPI003182B852
MSLSLPMRKAIVLKRSRFWELLQRAMAGEELSAEEGALLLKAEGKKLQALIQTADEVRRRRVGDIVTYVKNRNINFTNVCIGSCKFCAFRRNPEDPQAYVLSPEQIESKVNEALEANVTEICIQGGLHPDFGLEDYLEIIQTVKKTAPGIHVHAFSPAEINYIAEKEDMGLEEVIVRLKEAGLDSVPGTAAEILVDRVRSIICPEKISTEQWIKTIKACHRLGLPTTATMMYGHVETPLEQARHISIIREIQKETHGFTEFVLLGFVSRNTLLGREFNLRPYPDLVHSLRLHAVARLMLAGYIDNIQTSWVKLGPRGAQLMLKAGANDLGGTLMEENITKAAGGSLCSMTAAQLEHLILEIGRIPRQRTTTYDLI